MVPDKEIFPPWKPEFLMEFNNLNNNERSSHKDHFCKVYLQLAMWCRRRCGLKKTDRCTDAERRTVTYHNLLTKKKNIIMITSI